MIFVPVLAFAVVSFLLLGAFVAYSNPDFALIPWLVAGRFAAWIVALSISTLVFYPAIARDRIRAGRATLFAALSILIFYPSDGFLRAHAEERIIRYKTTHSNPSDDMGASYLYGSFSPGTGGSSSGAKDAARYAWRDLQWAALFALVWLPFVSIVADRVFRDEPPLPNARDV